MSRNTVAFRRRFEQAIGNNHEDKLNRRERIYIRTAEAAFDAIIPKAAKGRGTFLGHGPKGKRCCMPISARKEKILREACGVDKRRV